MGHRAYKRVRCVRHLRSVPMQAVMTLWLAERAENSIPNYYVLAQDSIGNPKGDNAFFAWTGTPRYGPHKAAETTCNTATA